MSIRHTAFLGLFALAAGVSVLGGQTRPNIKPKAGYVPNETTAVVIGEAVLVPIWGERDIARHRPYRATLANGVWTVRGTLPPGWGGGTAVVRLAVDDGRILQVFHEQ
jgi:hypothetical protein